MTKKKHYIKTIEDIKYCEENGLTIYSDCYTNYFYKFENGCWNEFYNNGKNLSFYNHGLNVCDGELYYYEEESEEQTEATEKWQVLEKFPDYQVSTLGRVFSMKRDKILKPYKSRGYCLVDLGTRKIKRCAVYVHRLVAETFIPNPENKEEVNHKNSRRDDNRVENLEWVTPKENVRHSYEFGFARFRNNNRDKQREACSQPIVCVETGIKYDSISDASRKLGLHKPNIARCVKNKNKSVHKLHFLPLPKLTKAEIQEFMEKAE